MGFHHLGTYGGTKDPTGVVESIRVRTSDPSLLDEDEIFPSREVVEEATQFVEGLYALLDAPPPQATVGTFFGELNIAWRSGNRVVRIAFFPDRPTALTFGSLSEPVGSYRSHSNPTPSEVAAQLTALSPALV